MAALQQAVVKALQVAFLALLVLVLSCEGGASEKATSTASGQSTWVQARIGALEALYGFTPQGRRFLEGVDLRQMEGQPGWFGSFGLQGWTGVGEARPESIIHELSHAYWGAFPVSGYPDLGWEEPGSGGASPAMAQYHRDIVTFLAQPPDPYEPLRGRLRNIPRVLLGESAPLLHFGEADLLHATGGNLLLLPPILRRYYDQLLSPGPFDSWYSAMGWYRGLSPEDARVSGVYFGLTHFSLEEYGDLEPLGSAVLPRRASEAVAQEERQRLVDFARQFDVVTGAGGDSPVDLFFLRGYLRDKLALYKRHPDVLAGLKEELPIAASLERVLKTFASLEGRPLEEQAGVLGQYLKEPLFSTFWPLVDNALLMELRKPRRGVIRLEPDTVYPESLEGRVETQTERLSRLVYRAGYILDQALEDPVSGAASLSELIQETPKKDMAEVGLVIELLRAADRETAEAIGRELDGDPVRRLLEEASGALRQLLGPQELLRILGITLEASAEELIQGIRELLQGTSGNFRIDRPYLSRVYALVVQRGEKRPQEALDVLLRSGLFLEDLLREHSQEAVAILSSDLERAVDLIASVEGHGRTPQRVVHSIVFVDPVLAARLVVRLDAENPAAVREALIHFAYDSYRKARLPSLKVSPERDGRFLLALADLAGDGWVIERMGEAIATYDGYVKAGIVPPDFLQAYGDTLEEAASLLDGPDAETRLRNLAGAAFSRAGVAY